MTFTRTLICPLVAAAVLAAAPAFGQDDDGLQTFQLRHQQRTRTYHVHTPQPRVNGLLPTLLVLHGGGNGDAQQVAGITQYNDLADQHGFQAVYPEGVDAQWNDGRGITFRGGVEGVDDVGFFDKLFDRLINRHRADPSRIYVTGLSNGGMMTLRLGIELGHRIAAIAPVIANIPQNLANQTPPAPLPILLMNGTADPLVPYEGGALTVGLGEYGELLSTNETIWFWIRANRQRGQRVQVSTQALPDRAPDDDSQVYRTIYSNLQAPVVLYRVEGGGHTFPGGNVVDVPRLLGPRNDDIQGNVHIWTFLSQFRR